MHNSTGEAISASSAGSDYADLGDIDAYEASTSANPGRRPAAAFKIVDQNLVGDFRA